MFFATYGDGLVVDFVRSILFLVADGVEVLVLALNDFTGDVGAIILVAEGGRMAVPRAEVGSVPFAVTGDELGPNVRSNERNLKIEIVPSVPDTFYKHVAVKVFVVLVDGEAGVLGQGYLEVHLALGVRESHWWGG